MSDIYVVLGINLIVWAGVMGYMMYLHNKVRHLKHIMKQKNITETEQSE